MMGFLFAVAPLLRSGRGVGVRVCEAPRGFAARPHPALRATFSRKREKDSYWQASQLSGFSSEHAIALVGRCSELPAAAAPPTVALAIFVAGRERRYSEIGRESCRDRVCQYV